MTRSSVEVVSPLDAGFLDLDRNPTLVTHMGTLWVLDGEPTWEELLAGLDDLADRAPRLRARARHVPLVGFVWDEDPGFDVRRHLRRVELGPRADTDAVLAEAGLEFAESLERSKPLWDV